MCHRRGSEHHHAGSTRDVPAVRFLTDLPVRPVLGALLALGIGGSGCTAPSDSPLGRRVMWRTPFATAGSHTQPLVLDSTVVFATRAGWVVAVNRLTGAERWRSQVLPAETPILGRNMVSDGRIVLVPALHLVALDAHTGARVWTFDVEGDAVGDESVALADSLAFTAGAAGRLYAVDARTGAERWRLELGERPFGLRISNDLLFFGTRGITPDGLGAGHAMAVEARTGRERWRVEIPDAPGRPRSGGSTGFPAVAASRVYFTGMSGRVYALEAGTGALIWQAGEWSGATNPYDTGPVLLGGMVVTARDDGQVLGWDVMSGAPRWSARVGSPVDQPTSDGGQLFVNTSR